MKKYEEFRENLNKLMEGFTALKLDKTLNKEEFSILIDFDITDQFNDNYNWQQNEYGTQDLAVTIETRNVDNELIECVLMLEVDQDKNITHIVDFDEYYF